jgi:aspartate-semialdehyde dehydrogenase
VEVLRSEIESLGADPDALVTGAWRDPGNDLYARPIGFNVLPLAGTVVDDGYTDEEWKLVNETRKILDAPDVAIEPTCVRVPTMVGHAIAATMFFERDVGLDEARSVLATAPGVQLWDDEKVPTPLDSAGIDDVLVGRVRETMGTPGGVNAWVVGDNLRKGAALNAVQLAELLLA